MSSDNMSTGHSVWGAWIMSRGMFVAHWTVLLILPGYAKISEELNTFSYILVQLVGNIWEADVKTHSWKEIL